jgi:hypothetical protein
MDANKGLNLRSFAAHRPEVSDGTHGKCEISGPTGWTGRTQIRLMILRSLRRQGGNGVYGFDVFLFVSTRVHSRLELTGHVRFTGPTGSKGGEPRSTR